MLHSAPTGIVTLVFSDVPAAAELTAAVPRPWGRARAKIDRLQARLLRSHGGYAGSAHGVDVHVFEDAGAALHWCVDLQRLLLQVKWSAAILRQPAAANDSDVWNGPRVRMAIHSCEPRIRAELRRSRFRYFGEPIAPGLQALEAAHGGQIVLTGNAWTRVIPYIGDTLRSEVLGQYELDEEAHVLVQVLPEELASRPFPPVNAATLAVPDAAALDKAALGFALAEMGQQFEEAEA